MIEPPRRGRVIAAALTCGTVAGAALLIASERTTLCTISVATSRQPIRSITSAHVNHWAMAVIAVCALLLAAGLWLRAGRRSAAAAANVALGAILVLGVLALVLALAHDLPRAQMQGLLLIGGAPHLGRASPTTGMYLETLGAIVLIATGGSGLLLGGVPALRSSRREGYPADNRHPERG